MTEYRALLGPVFVIVLFVSAMLWSPFEPHPPPVVDDAFGVAPMPGGEWRDDDWTVFAGKVEWGIGLGLDSMDLGSAMAELGRSFVGTAYIPQTLEVPGPERVVINFRGLDCVTFVENMYAMARFLRLGPGEIGRMDRRDAERRYERILTDIRYRNGTVDGYPSRLHYFSDWIAHNSDRGLVRDMTRELGGVEDDTRIDFMTTHADAYGQLSEPANVAAIREVERALNGGERFFIPKDRIADVASRIRNGDVIAATSTVDGLDVAHTGLALWVDNELRLLHAPLVGEAVQISEVSLAERIKRIDGQDGILVARPVR